VGDREQMGSGHAPVISIGRVVLRTYLAPFAQDGWSFGGRSPDAHRAAAHGKPSVSALSRRYAPHTPWRLAPGAWRLAL
jgi:hypothetical protein